MKLRNVDKSLITIYNVFMGKYIYPDLHADSFLGYNLLWIGDFVHLEMHQTTSEQSRLSVVVREMRVIPQWDISWHWHFGIHWFGVGSWSKTQNWAHLADDWLIWTTQRTNTSETTMVVAANTDYIPMKALRSPWCHTAISILYKSLGAGLVPSWALPREVCAAPSLPARKGGGVWPLRSLFQSSSKGPSCHWQFHFHAYRWAWAFLCRADQSVGSFPEPTGATSTSRVQVVLELRK